MRDPKNLSSYGHADLGRLRGVGLLLGAGLRQAGKAGAPTNIVYSVDLVRGLDVYAVDLPGGGTSTGEDPLPPLPLASLAGWSPFSSGGLPVTGVLLALSVAVLLRRRGAVVATG